MYQNSGEKLAKEDTHIHILHPPRMFITAPELSASGQQDKTLKRSGPGFGGQRVTHRHTSTHLTTHTTKKQLKQKSCRQKPEVSDSVENTANKSRK